MDSPLLLQAKSHSVRGCVHKSSRNWLKTQFLLCLKPKDKRLTANSLTTEAGTSAWQSLELMQDNATSRTGCDMPLQHQLDPGLGFGWP